MVAFADLTHRFCFSSLSAERTSVLPRTDLKVPGTLASVFPTTSPCPPETFRLRSGQVCSCAGKIFQDRYGCVSIFSQCLHHQIDDCILVLFGVPDRSFVCDTLMADWDYSSFAFSRYFLPQHISLCECAMLVYFFCANGIIQEKSCTFVSPY